MATSTNPQVIVQGPGDKLDYLFDYTGILPEADSVLSSTWTVPAAITYTDASYEDRYTAVWFEGGTSNTSYAIENYVVSAEGRELTTTITLQIKDM